MVIHIVRVNRFVAFGILLPSKNSVFQYVKYFYFQNSRILHTESKNISHTEKHFSNILVVFLVVFYEGCNAYFTANAATLPSRAKVPICLFRKRSIIVDFGQDSYPGSPDL